VFAGIYVKQIWQKASIANHSWELQPAIILENLVVA
jgi:hypothetical protein